MCYSHLYFIFMDLNYFLKYVILSVCAVLVISCVQLLANLWTVAHKSPLSMGSYRQEYWSGLPFPSPGNLPNPGIKPVSPVSSTLQVHSLPAELSGKPILSVTLSLILITP